MNVLYVRFGLETNVSSEESKFRNKVENLMTNGAFGADILNDDEDNIVWRFDNEMGEKHRAHYGSTDTMTAHMLGHQFELNEYLFRLQVLINLLWDSRPSASTSLAAFAERFLEESSIDLGYFVKHYKTKAPQILPASNKRLQKKLITALDQLEAKPEKYKPTIEHFEAGIKEMLTAKTKLQLKDVAEDMSSVCDSLVKIKFNDENLGFKHLFKEDRWKKIKLNQLEKKIFSDLNNSLDQIKHDVIKTYSRQDIELLVELTSELINRIAK